MITISSMIVDHEEWAIQNDVRAIKAWGEGRSDDAMMYEARAEADRTAAQSLKRIVGGDRRGARR